MKLTSSPIVYGLKSVEVFKDVRYSKAQKMLKFTFNALIQQLLLQYC